MRLSSKFRSCNGSIQTVLLVLIILIVGGLIGGVLVYTAAQKNRLPMATSTKIVYPPGTTIPSFAPVVDVIKPAVVNIYTEQIIRNPFRSTRPQDRGPLNEFFNDDVFKFFFGQPPNSSSMSSLGSGVIVDPAGYVLTNNHVVEQADKIKVKLFDGTEYKATIVGRDPKTDLALIKIEGKTIFPKAELGDSDIIRVGDWVLAIGNPFGYTESVSHGIISALGRKIDVSDYSDFIQTDAAINPGNSGGPLVNLKGEVIGINTIIATRTGANIGIGFAIPSNLAKTVFTELRKNGKVVRGWLGVGLQDVNSDLAQKLGVTNGVRITKVYKDSPAEKVSLKVDDVITEFDGKKITKLEQLRQLVSSSKIGKPVKLTVVRNHQVMSFQITIAEMPADTSKIFKQENGVDLGLVVEDLNPQQIRKLKLGKNMGVLVTDVESGSLGDTNGIQKNDVILEINDKPIKTVEDYDVTLGQVHPGDKIFLRIFRDGYIIILSFNSE